MIVDTFWQAGQTLLQNYAAGAVMNGTAIVVAYFLFWRLLSNRLKAWRIQALERVTNAQIKSEIGNAVSVLAVASVFASLVGWLVANGYSQVYTTFSDYHPLVAIGMLPLLWLIDDAWFYAVHRLLHANKFLFKHVHAVHHRSVAVNPFTSLSFHWLEPFLLTLWVIPVIFIVPIYAPVLAVLQLIGLLDNIKSHLGYEIYPAWLNRSPLRFLTTSTYHNLHHTKFKGNYGVHFRFWDKLCATELPVYEATFDEVQRRKSALPPSPV
jgi:Delta7-sterol 5-desaturase